MMAMCIPAQLDRIPLQLRVPTLMWGLGGGGGGVREDFEKAEVGPLPASLMIIDGGWVVAEAETGGKVLELQSEPVVDGVVWWGRR